MDSLEYLFPAIRKVVFFYVVVGHVGFEVVQVILELLHGRPQLLTEPPHAKAQKRQYGVNDVLDFHY